MCCATVLTMPPARSSFYPRVFASVTAVVLGIAVLRIMQPFLGPLLWATLLAFMVFPLNERLRAAFRGRASLAALLLTLASILMFVVPAIFLGVMFGRQASELIGQLQTSAAQHQIQRPSDVLQLPQVDRLVQWVESSLPISSEQIRDSLLSAGQQIIQSIISLGGSLFASVFGLIVAIILALFLLFFFLRDGERMVARAMVVVPLDDRRKAHLLTHLASVIRATVLGSLVTALVQGTLVGIGFALAGLPWPIVFAVLSMGAAMIPLIGTAVVWIPAAAWLLLTGHWGAALFFVIWGAAVVSSADNVVRPLFISSRARIATLPVFIGLIGGISAFGAIGIFLGPVVIALVLALFKFAEDALNEQKAAEDAAGPAAAP
jgi:predicted PurR-regulated permease PerM